MKLFLSYKFEDAPFVHRVYYHLKRQVGLEPFCYAEQKDFDKWHELVSRRLKSCDGLVLFCPSSFIANGQVPSGIGLGVYQIMEVSKFYDQNKGNFGNSTWIVELQDATQGNASSALAKEALGDLRGVLNVEGKLITVRNSKIQRNDSGGTGPVARNEYFSLQTVQFEDEACNCARKITKAVLQKDLWIEDDELPIGYPFDYEKDIIADYSAGKGKLLDPKRLEQGCPIEWPDVLTLQSFQSTQPDEEDRRNPIPTDEIGPYRQCDARILVDVRSRYHSPVEGTCLARSGLSFPEAGPRERLTFDPAETLRVGIVVSGGIAPGINAVVAGIIERHYLYYRRACEHRKMVLEDPDKHTRLEIVLYQDGFTGLVNGSKQIINSESLMRGTALEADFGGSMVGTSRFDDLLSPQNPARRQQRLETVVDRVANHDKVSVLYVIGGDGSMRAAHAIYATASNMRKRGKLDGREISVVAVPKTMDNDILWVWQSFGFLSAVERAKQAITQLYTEVKSNPRLCVIQLFGSDSGFVVSHAALATVECDGALIPEVPFTMKALSEHVQHAMHARFYERTRAFGTVLLAETAIPLDVEEYLDDPDVALEEKEKAAIRTFIGSSLLNVTDITDWRRFCKKTVGEASNEKNIIVGQLWARLPAEAQAVLESVAKSKDSWDENNLKSTIVKALNQFVLKDPIFCSEHSCDEGEADLILEVANRISKIKFHDEVSFLLQELAGISLPFEAKEIEKQLKQSQPEERLVEIAQRLRQLLIEKRNRLLLEHAYQDELLRCPTFDEPGRVHGQTPDELRTGGLKIIARVLQKQIRKADKFAPRLAKKPEYQQYCKQFRVFTNEPRHLLRAIAPSASDVVFGRRLGILAVDNAMAGYTDFMVSQWLTEYVLIPLRLVVLGRKRVPRNGIFWKSVLAKTRTAEMFK